jgi:hypothetical protein
MHHSMTHTILAVALKHASDADQHSCHDCSLYCGISDGGIPDGGPLQAAVEELEQQVQQAAGQLSTLQQRTGVPAVKSC